MPSLHHRLTLTPPPRPAPFLRPPSRPQNELEFFRMRTKEREILAAPEENFLVIVVQRWKSGEGEAK
jgi:hypothetical protein